MHALAKVPALVAALVAVAGTAVILAGNISAAPDQQDRANARMITAAAVSRAGAIEILPKRAAGRPAS
jgi:hypothetical protein